MFLNSNDIQQKTKQLNNVTPIKKPRERIPDYPDDWQNLLPDPWPQLWDNWKRLSPNVIQPLLLPTFLASNAFMLNCHYVTEHSRRPNFQFLAVAGSTIGKDDSSKIVLLNLCEQMCINSHQNFHWEKYFKNPTNDITADISFLESFDDDQRMFWLKGEGSRLYHQLSISGKTNSAMGALSDKMIEGDDGLYIPGKNKAGQSTHKGIGNPNYQGIIYTQPESLKDHIRADMVDSGFLGRPLISIAPDDISTAEEVVSSMFTRRTNANTPMDPDVCQFYRDMTAELSRTTIPTKLPLGKDNTAKLINFFTPLLSPFIKNVQYGKMLKRLAIPTEKLYCIVLAYSQLWANHTGNKIPVSFDVSCLFDILTYWTYTKRYAIDNYVNQDCDVISTEIITIISDYLTGNLSTPEISTQTFIKEHQLVPIFCISRAIRNRPKVKKLISGNANVSLANRVLQTVTALNRLGETTMIEIDGSIWVGLAK